jgi:hypothetical protein
MTPFLQLLEEVADEKNNSLSSLLFKARLLASHLRSPKFQKWVNDELEGYPDIKSVPEYRVIKPIILGDFWGSFGAKTLNVQLSTIGWPKEYSDLVENFYFIDNIGQIEAMLDTSSETYNRRFDIWILELFRQHPGPRVSGESLQYVHGIFTKSEIRGVLHSIRSRLLNLLIELREKYPELEEQNAAVSKIPAEDVTQIVDKVIYNRCTIIGEQSKSIVHGDLKMGDTYQAGQAGAIGPNAHAHDINFQQIWNDKGGHINLEKLQSELETLRNVMSEKAASSDHYIEIGNVAAAEKAVRDGSGEKALEYLARTGKWTLAVAQKIGVEVAICALKAALRL